MSHWVSIHLFYEKPWDHLLIQVKSLVESLVEKGLVEQYFFIRYWVGGPHIRLRLKVPASDVEKVKAMARATFEIYMQRYPSVRKDPDDVAQGILTPKWFPNNSVQFIAYEPEFRRYGGALGLPLAERHFFLSSRTVFCAMAQSSSWNYGRAMAIAIQLHVLFCHCLGMSRGAQKDFFSQFCSEWLKNSYAFGKRLSKEEDQRLAESTLQAFAEKAEQQKKGLAACVSVIRHHLEQGQPFAEPWLNIWADGMRAFAKALTGLPHKADAQPVQEENNHPFACYQGMLSSLVHMTHNRLGIQNQDEAFLGFLLAQLQKTEEH